MIDLENIGPEELRKEMAAILAKGYLRSCRSKPARNSLDDEETPALMEAVVNRAESEARKEQS